MKNFITRLTLLLGALLLLGTGNGKAATTYSINGTIYYDPAPYNEANPDTPLPLQNNEVKVIFYNYQMNTSSSYYFTGSMSYDDTKKLFYYDLDKTTTSYSQYPMYLSFVKGSDPISAKALINEGKAQANWGNTNMADGSGMISIVLGGTYDWNSKQEIPIQANVPTGVSNMLAWSNNAAIQVSMATNYALPYYYVDFTLDSDVMKDKLSFTLNSSIEGVTPTITVKNASGQDVTNNTNICSIDGNVVTFTLAAMPGDYTLTGMISGDDTVSPTEVLARLQNPSVSFTYSVPSGNRSQVWTTGTVTFNVINNPQIVNLTADDFNVTFVPDGITTPNLPGSRPSDMETWEWQQMEGIMKAGNNVDGFYQEPTVTTIISGNTLQVTVHFPVSGTYKLNVTCNNDYVVLTPTNSSTAITVNVAPTWDLIYKDYYVGDTYINRNDGLNINGMQNSDGDINYYYDTTTEEWWGDLKNAILYTPGFYLGTIYYILSEENLASELTADSTDWNTLDDHTIDISALESGNNQNLYIMFEKNGLKSEPTSFLLQKTTSVPTGVEGIEAETEGEAVYYNLQGVKVANPERGIFVKVVGGKATKVIL